MGFLVMSNCNVYTFFAGGCVSRVLSQITEKYLARNEQSRSEEGSHEEHKAGPDHRSSTPTHPSSQCSSGCLAPGRGSLAIHPTSPPRPAVSLKQQNVPPT